MKIRGAHSSPANLSGLTQRTCPHAVPCANTDGRIFLTVTHYQNWTLEGNGNMPNDYKVHGQDPREGSKSAWFYIKMKE